MHDPYLVFDAKREEIIYSLREQWVDNQVLIQKAENSLSQRNLIVTEKKIDLEIEKLTNTEDVPVQKLQTSKESQIKQKENIQEVILEAWNNCKPESYSSIRRISNKQMECVKKHMVNLGIAPSDASHFICSVCTGINKSDFWNGKIAMHSRNFNAVFGYGAPQDTKMKNIEDLYNLGNDDSQSASVQKAEETKLPLDVTELIDSYRYIFLNYENHKLRGDKKEEDRWMKHLADVTELLNEKGIDINGL